MKVFSFQPELPDAGEQAVTELGEGTTEEEIVVWKGPVTPRPWESLGSEVDVEGEKTIENRGKVIYLSIYLKQTMSTVNC